MTDSLPTVTVPLRWADIDQLAHVNNVAFLDYACAAHERLVDAGDIAANPIRAVDIEYHRPLLLSAGEVDISHEWQHSSLVQQFYSGDDVYATVIIGYQAAHAPGIDARAQHRITPRHSDLDTNGQIGLIALFEYMQEARIAFITERIRNWAAGGFVVARVAMTVYRPVPLKAGRYDIHAVIERVGTSSVSVHTQIVDGGHVYAAADSVLVGFDLENQTSRPFSDDERTVLLEAATPTV